MRTSMTMALNILADKFTSPHLLLQVALERGLVSPLRSRRSSLRLNADDLDNSFESSTASHMLPLTGIEANADSHWLNKEVYKRNDVESTKDTAAVILDSIGPDPIRSK